MARLLSQESPLSVVVIIAAVFAGCAFAFGVATGDYSWVDRLWSTAPVLFVWIYAVKGGFDARITVAAIVVTIWGARLTYNFARKGGYSGEEDYRWSILHDRMPNPLLWQSFHLLFIAIYQIGLFVLFTLPFNILFSTRGLPLDAGFILLAAVVLGFVLFETVADQQQWNFQTLKNTRKGAAEISPGFDQEDLRRGFLTTGLFRLSRHPNYFAELSVWWFVYLMSAYQTMHILNATIVGPVLLTLLFIGSTRFTESISRSKYPEYREYQSRTSPIIPWFPSRDTESERASAGTGE